MEQSLAIEALGALAQPTRMQAFRLLIAHEPDGLAAGDIAAQLGVPQNTMSTHLATLSRAGLISFERQSRSIIYRAELDRVREIASFLISDCCRGRPELCQPLVDEFTPRCNPKEGSDACC
jgi:DNA-binding transcriptional ArsR family regulator